jgi:hypothetical protein
MDSIWERDGPMTPASKLDDLNRQLTMPEEDRRAHPTAPQWTGGYRWFRSANVVDLQNYRSPGEKQRIMGRLLFMPAKSA